MGMTLDMVTASFCIKSRLLFFKFSLKGRIKDWRNDLECLAVHPSTPHTLTYNMASIKTAEAKTFPWRHSFELRTGTQVVAPATQTADMRFCISVLKLRVTFPALTSWVLLGLMSLHSNTSSSASFSLAHLVFQNSKHRISALTSSF